jgi:hypothetical protein
VNAGRLGERDAANSFPTTLRATISDAAQVVPTMQANARPAARQSSHKPHPVGADDQQQWEPHQRQQAEQAQDRERLVMRCGRRASWPVGRERELRRLRPTLPRDVEHAPHGDPIPVLGHLIAGHGHDAKRTSREPGVVDLIVEVQLVRRDAPERIGSVAGGRHAHAVPPSALVGRHLVQQPVEVHVGAHRHQRLPRAAGGEDPEADADRGDPEKRDRPPSSHGPIVPAETDES